MVLLSLLALGLLSLSNVAMRTSGRSSDDRLARANARLALDLAVAQLQQSLGDDRRITANASLLLGAEDTSDRGNVLGVWESWSPELSKNPGGTAPNYESEKEQRFQRWLISGNHEELKNKDWIKNSASGTSVSLFAEDKDGFALQAPLIEISGNEKDGGYAWAAVQENTKAKISVSGPESNQVLANDNLQAQPRPNLSLGDVYKQPASEWSKRASRVLDLQQAKLDPDLAPNSTTGVRSDIYTASSFGLLTNVVDGGLKVDLSLGLELDERDFNAQNWSSVRNPFHASAEDDFATPGAYGSQRPLYEPQSETGNVVFTRGDFAPANVQGYVPVAAAPTFHTLRSFYRTPHHLYKSSGSGLTMFERESDHIASKPGSTRSGHYPPPSDTVDGDQTQVAFRPVLDRVMFVISGGLSQTDELRMVITPLIALWNPYNVALEIEGAVSYVWLDVPYRLDWTVNGRSGTEKFTTLASPLMGSQFNAGRSVNPYFYAAITADGQPLSQSGAAKPISFQPGEVRLFAPTTQSLVDYQVNGTIRERTIFLSPVESPNQLSTKGGLSIPTYNPVRRKGFTRVLGKTESAQMSFSAVTNQVYPFCVTLEDATRAKGSSPSHEDRGKAIADIMATSFTQTGETSSFSSPMSSYNQFKTEPVMIGVLESFHRVAKGGAQTADLVFTGNPRQPWMNPFITKTSFATGPQYQVRMRSTSSFNELIQSTNGGRNGFYGASQSPGLDGRTHLSFFSVPTSPMLSLAEFQHADLSPTPFAPANQFGNSWASAYVRRNQVVDTAAEVDHCYLLNESLWDDYFFSGASPVLTHSIASGEPGVWDREMANESASLATVLEEFSDDPIAHPLRNSRMRFHQGNVATTAFSKEMLEPDGCTKIAGHLLVDGAFNINSTSVEAWKAVLAGLRGSSMNLADGSSVSNGNLTPFPRLSDPLGTANDNWQGFRALSDDDLEKLAERIVEEVHTRGPFLSLAEFINRRVSSDDMGLKGALQTAIDESGLNQAAMQETFSASNYERAELINISPRDTGVGIPGYLTQADLLKSIAPVITVRSDTFIVRAYGETKDAAGNVTASATIEAVVQRVPEFIDQGDSPNTPIAELSALNSKFGRRLQIVSFRFLTREESQSNSTT